MKPCLRGAKVLGWRVLVSPEFTEPAKRVYEILLVCFSLRKKRTRESLLDPQGRRFVYGVICQPDPKALQM